MYADQQIGQLIAADVEKAGEFADLEIDVLPLQFRHRGVPADEFAVVDRRRPAFVA